MYRPGYGIRLRSSARTSKGRVRQNNEDSIHLWGDDGYVLAVVADGMGGAAAGEEASRIAVETIQEMMVNSRYRKPDDYSSVDSSDLAEKLETAVRQANLSILKRASHRPELKGMGTTLTMAFARRSEVVIAHVGDSRAYLVDGQDGSITQITSDHTFVQALVDAGHIKPEEARDHPMGNVLYRALGQSSEVDIDLVSDVYMQPGDRLVLCSDGLTLHVRTPEIATIAMSEQDPVIISSELIDLANLRGGKDNISVIVIVAEDASDYRLNETMTMAALDEFGDDDPTIPLPPPTGSLFKLSDNAYGEGRDMLEPLQ
ncbi:MAG: Stp1/IreP family PP2C-type Ser/Thr phosphatase [Anaerolineae bacterium]|jgi:protein phosphatase|nr:Stp1/IreP family PP2C-type Ser/Thr phosphatase [Anaerolineae bacterium]